MKIFWKDLVVFEGEGAAAGGGSGGGQQPAGGQQPSGSQQPASGGGAPQNLAEAAAAHAAANGGQQQQQQPNGQQPGGQQQPNGQQAPQAYYPENLPEAFRGATDRETIDKLNGEIAGRPKAPATAQDYKFEFADDFKNKFGDLKDDPVLPMWAEIAHELGLSNEAAVGVVPKLYDKLAKAGLIPEPVDINAEMAKLEPGEKDPIRQQAKAAARVNAIANRLKGLEARGILSKADMVRTSIVFADAANVAAFEKIFNQLPAEHGPQGGNGEGGNGGLTKAGLEAAMKDPRYDTFNPKFDRSYREKVDADWRRMHGAT